MPNFVPPGVFVEETGGGAKPIAGVAISTAAFIGVSQRGSYRARLVTSLAEFERSYGAVQPVARSYLGRAVHGFFANGGRRAWVARVAATRGKFTAVSFIGETPTGSRFARGLTALGEIDEMLLVAAPDLSHPRMEAAERARLRAALVAQAQTRRDRVVLLDAPSGDRGLGKDDPAFQTLDSSYAAVYGPFLSVAQSDGTSALLPPSGHVAGVIARIDEERGVHKAPAGVTIVDALGLEFAVTSGEQDALTAAGFNAVRELPGRGLQIWGVRLRTSDPEWRYLNIRRLAIFLERSIAKGLAWVVFEPNDEPLWTRVRGLVEDFLLESWRAGALLGARPENGFFVRCDRSTMTQAEIDAGRLICVIGIAPLRPAEFVVIRVSVCRHRDP